MINLERENSTSGGLDCLFWDFGEGVGLKLYDEEYIGIGAWVVQEDLARMGLAPKTLSEPQGFYYNWDGKYEMRFGYLTEVVTVAGDTLSNFEESNEVYNLISMEGMSFLKELQNKLGTDAGLDFHSQNWGFDKNSKPVMIDTGWDFYQKVERYRYLRDM